MKDLASLFGFAYIYLCRQDEYLTLLVLIKLFVWDWSREMPDSISIFSFSLAYIITSELTRAARGSGETRIQSCSMASLEAALRALLSHQQGEGASSDMKAFREVFAKAKKIVVLSGAGMSAESGVPTFRSDDAHHAWL